MAEDNPHEGENKHDEDERENDNQRHVIERSAEYDNTDQPEREEDKATKRRNGPRRWIRRHGSAVGASNK